MQCQTTTATMAAAAAAATVTNIIFVISLELAAIIITMILFFFASISVCGSPECQCDKMVTVIESARAKPNLKLGRNTHFWIVSRKSIERLALVKMCSEFVRLKGKVEWFRFQLNKFCKLILTCCLPPSLSAADKNVRRNENTDNSRLIPSSWWKIQHEHNEYRFLAFAAFFWYFFFSPSRQIAGHSSHGAQITQKMIDDARFENRIGSGKDREKTA